VREAAETNTRLGLISDSSNNGNGGPSQPKGCEKTTGDHVTDTSRLAHYLSRYEGGSLRATQITFPCRTRFLDPHTSEMNRICAHVKAEHPSFFQL